MAITLTATPEAQIFETPLPRFVAVFNRFGDSRTHKKKLPEHWLLAIPEARHG